MLRTALAASLAAVIWLFSGAGPPAAGCEPAGRVRFICGVIDAEDLVPIPGTDWIVASGYGFPGSGSKGSLQLVNARDASSVVVFPADAARERPDTKTSGACPGPLGPAAREQFRSHGVGLRRQPNGAHTLYVVHHGSRESVEVFEIDTRGLAPELTWIGCVVAPPKISLNAVAALPGGDFAATDYAAKGSVWEWRQADGWRVVPDSETSRPNGLEVSPDGQWLFIGEWGSQSVTRLSRGLTPPKKDTVVVGFYVDNLRWAPDGSLFATGQGGSAPEAVTGCYIKSANCAALTTDVVRNESGRADVQVGRARAHERRVYVSRDERRPGRAGDLGRDRAGRPDRPVSLAVGIAWSALEPLSFRCRQPSVVLRSWSSAGPKDPPYLARGPQDGFDAKHSEDRGRPGPTNGRSTRTRDQGRRVLHASRDTLAAHR